MKNFFVLLFFGLLSILSALAQDSETYKNTDPIIKFFKMGKSEMTTIAPVNALGREINELYALTTWIGIGIFVVVAGIFFVIIISFREKKNSLPQMQEKSNLLEVARIQGSLKKSHSNKHLILEFFLFLIPTIIIIVIAIPTIRIIFKIEDFPSFQNKEQIVYKFDKEADQIYNKYLKVNVIGHQWWWEFEYLGMYELVGGKEKFTPIHKAVAGEARFPINTPVLFQVNSEDVIHSFWAPRLGGKIDANPGVDTKITFVFEEKGYFFGHCVEYCGASHALMRLNLVGVSAQEFQDWLAWGKGEPIAVSAAAQRGKDLMTSCVACHTMSGIRDFVPRRQKFEIALLDYFKQQQDYDSAIKQWKQTPKEELDGHFDLYKSKPKAPLKPRYYEGYLKTIAPDLTNIALKKRILSGIKLNNRETLVKWIQNPPSVKPEIRGTVVARMPAYENIYTKQQIEDIVEFLLTVEYSDAPKKETLVIK